MYQKYLNFFFQFNSTGVQENINQIHMQRELKEKSNQYSELFSKFNHLSQVYYILTKIILNKNNEYKN